MSGFRVMSAFAAGATIAGMVVGVARLTDVVEPSTAVAETPTMGSPTATPTATPTGSPEAGHPERSAVEGGAESRDPVSPAELSRRSTAIAASEPRPQQERPPGWRAPTGAPEEVTAGVLARVASRRAQAACEPARETAAAERKDRKRAPRDAKAAKAERCPPEEGIESVEIDWGHGSTSTR
ncbi:MAG TPA: hypothetical protein VLC54_09585 [Anaeromyxobacter sp.]|nr:hypothetical protein [Anaeromyxobacter sp.]